MGKGNGKIKDSQVPQNNTESIVGQIPNALIIQT